MSGPRPLPPRMAMVTTAHPWGDPRVFERELAACLDWGVETHVFLPLLEPPVRAGWSLDPRLVLHPLAVPGGRRQRFLLALGVWRAVLRHGPFALVHFHDPELVPAMALLGLLRPETYTLYDIHEDLPLQLASKDYLPDWLRGPVARLVSCMLRAAGELFSGFAPATEAIALAWPAARTRVVHNYPKALFGEGGSRPAPDPNRIIYLGGLSRVRGIPLALAAVREARTRLPGLRLELIGWVMDAETGQAIRAAEAEGWCLHLPRMGAPAMLERALGAGVGLVTLLPQPNYLQALPTKLFEYMAMGVPVLASDFPLWRQLVEGAGAGRVTDPEPGAFRVRVAPAASGFTPRASRARRVASSSALALAASLRARSSSRRDPAWASKRRCSRASSASVRSRLALADSQSAFSRASSGLRITSRPVPAATWRPGATRMDAMMPFTGAARRAWAASSPKASAGYQAPSALGSGTAMKRRPRISPRGSRPPLSAGPASVSCSVLPASLPAGFFRAQPIPARRTRARLIIMRFMGSPRGAGSGVRRGAGAGSGGAGGRPSGPPGAGGGWAGPRRAVPDPPPGAGPRPPRPG